MSHGGPKGAAETKANRRPTCSGSTASLLDAFFPVAFTGLVRQTGTTVPSRHPRTPMASSTRWQSDCTCHAQGEYWVILHRSMAEYVHKSPDNQARALMAYFSGVLVRAC